MHGSGFWGVASLVKAFVLAAALGSAPAQGGGDARLNVSATILPRAACSIARGVADTRGVEASLRTTFRCNGGGAVTTYRVRADGDLAATVTRNGAVTLTTTAGTRVLSIEW